MNNVKRIIAAGLVGTAVISTGVVASAEETTQKTPQQELREIMAANNVNDALQEKLLKFADTRVITDAQAEEMVNTTNQILDIYVQNGYSFGKLKNENPKEYKKVQNMAFGVLDVIGCNGNDNGDGTFSITDKKTYEDLLTVTKDELVGLVGNDKAAQIENLKTDIMPKLTDYMKTPVADRTKVPEKPPVVEPGTETPGENEKPADEEQGHEKERQDVLDGVNAIKSDDAAINEAKDKVLKILNDRSCTLDDLKAAKALVEALPDGPEKDALLKAIAYIEKYYKFPDGTTAGTALVEATKTPSTDNNNNANSGTTAKTATNFGNVAVAGLGLMTVAGAVFVISKKKIC